MADFTGSRGTHLRPDALGGAVAAFEGVRGGVGVINAPTGCKFGIGWAADVQDPFGSSLDPMDYSEQFYFGQARAPSTALDGMDYVYGSSPKLKDLLRVLDSKGHSIIGVVNGPGTALIGDDLRSLVKNLELRTPVVVSDLTGFMGCMADGFQKATLELLQALAPEERPIQPRRINLLGPMLFQKDWAMDLRELRSNLAVMGIEVGCVLTAGEGLENIRQLRSAALNVVTQEEYGGQLAAFLEKSYGMPFLSLDVLSPYGIEATDVWGREVARALGVSGEPWELSSQRTRKKAVHALARFATRTGLPRGVPYAFVGDSSQAASWTLFLTDYLGMRPVVLGLHEVGERSLAFLKHFLRERNLSADLLVHPDQYVLQESLRERSPWVVLGSRFEEQILLSWPSQSRPLFIEAAYPGWGKVRLTHRPLMGWDGCLTLLEDLINALQVHSTASL
ncbi:MAG: nitrogenase component 1 [Acidobacteria bacterium]|nr:nitrogenase component 1 [Acidobacteriota bacterium]